jgi:hypothetical protein
MKKMFKQDEKTNIQKGR